MPEILSKPRLSQQLRSTESEVRLHSYRDHPPTPPELSMLLLLLTAQQLPQLARQADCTTIQSEYSAEELSMLLLLLTA